MQPASNIRKDEQIIHILVWWLNQKCKKNICNGFFFPFFVLKWKTGKKSIWVKQNFLKVYSNWHFHFKMSVWNIITKYFDIFKTNCFDISKIFVFSCFIFAGNHLLNLTNIHEQFFGKFTIQQQQQQQKSPSSNYKALFSPL